MTAWIAIVVFGAIKVVGAWIFVWGEMREGSVDIFWVCESGVGVLPASGSVMGARVARWRDVWRSRWGVSTRRIKGD